MRDPSPARILFIEDDVGKRYVIARQLRAAGFLVDEATTGEQGIALVTPAHDVVVLDLRLPDMSGWEVCKRIKARPETSTIMVLELSATLATAQDRARGLDMGADAYLVHPVELIELVATINALTRLRRAIHERDLQREMLIATVSHDLRNPLSALSIGLELLGRSPSIGAHDRVVLERIDRNMTKMKRLIDQLLVFTQSLAGSVSIEKTALELDELTRSAVFDLGNADRIVIDVAGRATVDGDRDRLIQVIDNLVSNALKYGTGPVTVRLGPGDDPGKTARLSVHNRGAPIPPEAMATLFDPFKRASSSRGGFGLGLYIVDRIVRAHDGTLSVASSEAEGTTFTVNFPLG